MNSQSKFGPARPTAKEAAVQERDEEGKFHGFVIFNYDEHSECAHLVYANREVKRFKLLKSLFASTDASLTSGQRMKKEERLTLGESISFLANPKDGIIREFTRLEKKDSDFTDTKIVNNRVCKKVACALKKDQDGTTVRCYCAEFGDIQIPPNLSSRLMAEVDFMAWVQISVFHSQGPDGASQHPQLREQMQYDVIEVLGICTDTDSTVLIAPWVNLNVGSRHKDPYEDNSDDDYNNQVEPKTVKFVDGEVYDEATGIRKGVKGVFVAPGKILARRRKVLMSVGFRKEEEDMTGQAVSCDTVFSGRLNQELVYNYEVIETDDVENVNGKIYANVKPSVEYHGLLHHPKLGWVYDRYQVLGMLKGGRNSPSYRVCLSYVVQTSKQRLLKSAMAEGTGPTFVVDREDELSEPVADAVRVCTESFEDNMKDLRGIVFGRHIYAPEYGNMRFDLKKNLWGRFKTGSRVRFEADVEDGIFYSVRWMTLDPREWAFRGVDTRQGPAFQVVLAPGGPNYADLYICHPLQQLVSDPDQKLRPKREEYEKKPKKKNDPPPTYGAWIVEDTSETSVTRFKVLQVGDNPPNAVLENDRFKYATRETYKLPQPREEEQQSIVISRAASAAPSRSWSVAERYRAPSPAESMTIPSTSPTPSAASVRPAGDVIYEEEVETPTARRAPDHRDSMPAPTSTDGRHHDLRLRHDENHPDNEAYYPPEGTEAPYEDASEYGRSAAGHMGYQEWSDPDAPGSSRHSQNTSGYHRAPQRSAASRGGYHSEYGTSTRGEAPNGDAYGYHRYDGPQRGNREEWADTSQRGYREERSEPPQRGYREQWSNTPQQSYRAEWTEAPERGYPEEWADTQQRGYYDQRTEVPQRRYREERSEPPQRGYREQWSSAPRQDYRDDWADASQRGYREEWTDGPQRGYYDQRTDAPQRQWSNAQQGYHDDWAEPRASGSSRYGPNRPGTSRTQEEGAPSSNGSSGRVLSRMNRNKAFAQSIKP